VLVAAAAAIVHGGQTVESGIGVTALSSGTSVDDTAVAEPTDAAVESPQPMTTTGFEWT
jgi:hypothetical protein